MTTKPVSITDLADSIPADQLDPESDPRSGKPILLPEDSGRPADHVNQDALWPLIINFCPIYDLLG